MTPDQTARDQELRRQQETIFVRISPLLNELDKAIQQSTKGRLHDLYNLMDELQSTWAERYQIVCDAHNYLLDREPETTPEVGWGHVTRARQRGENAARLEGEVALRRAAALLTAEADRLAEKAVPV